MSFHVGQKVVFIGRKGGSWLALLERLLHPYIIPQQGCAYTIRNIYQGERATLIELVEIHEPPSTYWNPGWPDYLFRPIVERKTSISVFTAMLDTSKTKVPA